MRQARGLTLLIVLLALGCQPDGNARLHILFPDENAKVLVSSLEVWVLRSHGPSCEALVDGSVSTDHQKLQPVRQIHIPYPVVGPTPGLGKIPLGNHLFFVEAIGAQGGTLLRGCAVASVAGDGAVDVTVELVWVCQPSEEICGNGVDDDCDGEIDEGCPECRTGRDCDDDNPCTIDLCIEEECHWDNFPDDTRCSDGDRCTAEDRCVAGECRGSDKDCSAYDGTCQVGVCDAETGECGPTPVKNGDECSDGLWCTVGDACQDGVCVGQARDCADDDELCTQDYCREGAGDQGLCEHVTVPRPGAEGPPGDPTCNDGIDNDCDGAADDADPNCIECTADGDCDDTNPCTADYCVAFVCQNSLKDNGTHCDDGQFCTVREQCLDGVCTGEARLCSEVADACHDGTCLEDEDRCVAREKTDGTGCEDGLFCTVGDKCLSGICSGGERDCDDDDPCTDNGCDEELNTCTETLVPKPGAEGPAGHANCSNGADDDCDRAVDLDDTDCRECTSDTDCDDDNECTDDSCQSGECRNTAVQDGTGCDDEKWCTEEDECNAGLCGGTPRDCSSEADECHDGVCDEDGRACVAEQKNDGTPCNDGLFCTVNDECNAGVCGGSTRDCQDDDICTAGTCDDEIDECVQTLVPNPGAEGPPGHGSCQGGDDEDCDGKVDLEDEDCYECQADAECNDDNPCTDDTCDLGVCRRTPRENGAGCDDGQFCNGADTCQAGVCEHAGRDCADTHDCTDDSCNETSDACEHAVKSGQCLIGATCYAEFDTNPANACQHCSHSTNDRGWTDRSDSSSCDDGLFCNGADTCQGGVCQHAGRDCADAYDCTDDSCDEDGDSCVNAVQNGHCLIGAACFDESDTNPGNECQHCRHADDDRGWTDKSNGTPCADADFCDGAEVCDGHGACVAGADPCPGQLCRETDDRCVECLVHGDCDNGDFCDGEETCDANGDCQAGADPCPGSMCRELDDLCVECLADGDCDNDTFCDGAETCDASGDCQAGVDPCPGLACRELDEQCVNCLVDEDCDNGDYCDGEETCDAGGACLPGADPCPGQMCRESDDQCVECLVDGDCDNDTFCDGIDTCEGGVCDHPGNPCVDAYACTDDDCIEASDTCDNPVKAGECLIGGACYADDFENPGNECQRCWHADDPAAWSSKPDDTPCPNGVFCDGVDTCQSGVCTSPGNPCVDAYPCTDDDCTEVGQICDNPVKAGECLIGGSCYADGFENPGNECQRCWHADDPAAWSSKPDDTPCPNGVFCDGVDTCQGGVCTSPGNPCVDAYPCTDDDCTEVGQICDNPVKAGECLIGGSCYVDTEVNPGDFCETCDHATDPEAWTWTPKPAENDICGNGIDEDCDTVTDGCCQGNGTLGAGSTANVAGSPWYLVTADFNSDGIPDVATASRSDDKISVLLGNGADGRGNGTFTRTPPTDYGSGGDPFGLATADLDDDSALDLVVANINIASSISILWGNGDGTFGARQDIPIAGNATFPALGDFDADGLPDIAVSSYTEWAAIVLNQGSRSFAAPSYKSVAPNGSDPRSIVAGDFDADGILDLAVANWTTDNVTVLIGGGSDGKGDGDFTAPDAAHTIDACNAPTNIVTADFDEDGVLDLAVSCYFGDRIAVMLGDGSGGRGNGTFLLADRTLYNPGGSPTSVFPADMDADGILDLVVANNDEAEAAILFGDGANGRGNGDFLLPAYNIGTGSWPSAAVALDSTGDGIPDVATCDDGDATVTLLEGQGSGGIGDGSFVVAGSFSTGALPSPPVAGDLNNDSILDLLTAHASDDEAGSFLGTGGSGRGDHGFTAPGWSGTAGTTPSWVEAVDVTGDRVPDLLVANSGSESIGRFSGAGNGSFGAQVPYATDNATVTDSTPTMVRTADVDADAVLDLIVADESGNVMVLLGNGDGDGAPDGSFGAATEHAAGSGATALALGELDGDRILDLVVANRDADTVSVLLGDGAGGRGNGGFVPHGVEPTVAVGDAPVSVALADLNNDGVLDLVAANRDDDTLSVLLGDGDGSFTAAAESPLVVGDGPEMVIAVDLDGDHRPDLAAANAADGTVSVLLGDGDGTFTAAPDSPVSVGGSPSGLFAGHYDWDGRFDLAVSDSSGDRIVILKGGGTCTPP